ncbi:hypothetical protein [Sinomonas terrae]|uniref:Transposase n=1 Tax=Sinomonas terrae TaxID=2908838 RepID=A0ABS9U0I1_9MICC|nr:hypothetical protein [Sinomonas terrae]MCH6470208.1 hypothetical protein [Sinomonas terrae]
MDLAAEASELYALLPGEFTATRNERAKAAKAEGNALLAKQIGRLPKPSTAAWAVNMLARRRADEIGNVLDLGEELRRAQDELDPASMRELGQQRHRLLSAVVREGRSVAEELGVGISDAAASEMEQTLRAAMADPDAAAAVRSGQLVRTLSSNGIEPVDLAGAVAVPGALPEGDGRRSGAAEKPAKGGAKDAAKEAAEGAAKGATKEAEKSDRESERRGEEAERRRAEEARERERQEAQTELEEAERGAEQAAAELAEAERSVSETAARREGISKELDDLREQVAELEVQLEAVEREAGFAERARRLASRLAEQERRALDRARERLDRLS